MEEVFKRFDALLDKRFGQTTPPQNTPAGSPKGAVAPAQSITDTNKGITDPFESGWGSTEYYQMLADMLHPTVGKVISGHLLYALPTINIPNGYEARKEWAKTFDQGFGKVKEALATTTTGAAMGVSVAPPIIVTPLSLIGNLRDTCRVVMVDQGSDTARFQAMSTVAFGSLTQNTEPTEITQTLTKTDLVPLLTGAQQSVSFEMSESVLGDTVAAVNESFRLAELVQEDNTVLSTLDAATPAATLYGDETVSTEATVTSAMTFKAARLATAIDKLGGKGYTSDNAVVVVGPKQYGDLLKDIGPSNALTFWPSAATSGIIPDVYGFEVRRSGGVVTGVGSASIVTSHALVYKKQRTAGLGISRELLMEAFRDIKKNSTILKASVRLVGGALEPNSLVKIITA